MSKIAYRVRRQHRPCRRRLVWCTSAEHLSLMSEARSKQNQNKSLCGDNHRDN